MPPSKLRIDDLVVDFSSREVCKAGRRLGRRIGSKPLDVLRVLVDQQGKVVSRDMLLDVVWRDRCPTPDVVTQTIKLLRQALGDDASEPRIIETIARSGYRLLVTATWIEDEDERAGSASPVVDPVESRRPRRWAATAIVLGAAGLVGALALTSDRAAPVQSAPEAAGETERIEGAERLASGPEWEWQPRLSPDESSMAYLRRQPDGRDAIHVQELAPGASRQLTFPPESTSDSQPVWSPDGREIVFQRTSDTNCFLMMVAVEGGDPRELGPCRDIGAEIDWSPDGSSIVSGGPAGSRYSVLHQFSLATRTWAPIEYASGADWTDMSPRYSSDGQWIAFRRGAPGGDIWKVPAAGGQAKQVTDRGVEILGLDWAGPDGSLLASTYFGREGDPLLARIDPAGQVSRLAPMAVGRLDAGMRTGHIVFEHLDVQAKAMAWTPGAGKLSTTILSSSRGEALPSPAPDGRAIALLSDRSGQLAVWLVESEAAVPRMVSDLLPENRFPPQWSGDGLRVLVAGTSSQGQGIHEIDVASTKHRLLSLPGERHRFATYGADSTTLLVIAADSDGRQRLDVVLANTPQPTIIASLPGVAFAQWDATGDRLLFTRQSQAGLWAVDRLLRGERTISRLPDLGAYRFWAVSLGRIWVGRVDTDRNQSVLERIDDGSTYAYEDAGSLFPILSAHGDTVYATRFLQNGIDVSIVRPATN